MLVPIILKSRCDTISRMVQGKFQQERGSGNQLDQHNVRPMYVSLPAGANRPVWVHYVDHQQKVEV